jgi:signal peptidase I
MSSPFVGTEPGFRYPCRPRAATGAATHEVTMSGPQYQQPLTEAPAADVPVPRRRSRTLDAAIEILTTVVLAVVLYVVIQTFVVQTYRVEQDSMLPNLQPDQHLLIDKLTPRFDDYSRGDIVVFHPPDASSETPFIKRVIGLGGEHVDVRDGGVYINDVLLTEPYTFRNQPTEPVCGQGSWDVPAGSIFVLGDHRQQSTDSRCFGTVAVDQVIGRAWLRFWPLSTIGILQTPTYTDTAAN